MKLEQIYQDLSISNFISVFYRAGTSHLSKKYESYQIGYGQHQYLITLYTQDGLTQDELTKRVAVDKATTTRAIGKLKEAGYVTVDVDSADKRVHHVHLTQKALDVKDDILKIERQWEQELLNKLTAEDKETFLKLCRKIVSGKD